MSTASPPNPVPGPLEALPGGEEYFRLLVENSSDVATILDASGVNRYQSPSIERVLGYRADELLGSSAFERIHPDDHDVCRAALREMVAEPGSTRTVEFRYRHRDGTWRVLEARGRTLLPNSAAAGVIINSRDITDRKRAEEEVQRSEERFRSLIENAQDIIQIIDRDGRTLYASPSVQRFLGYTPEEMIGRTARDDLHPEDVEPTLEKLSQVVSRPGTTIAAEYRIRHKDGSWRVFEGYARTLGPHDAPEGVVVNARDITDRKRSEDELRFQKTLLEAQQATSLDGILVVSEAGEILSLNQRFVEMWGIPHELLQRRSDQLAIQYVLDQVKDPEPFTERIAELYERAHETSRDEIVLRDGRVFDRYSAPVRDEEGRYYGRIWFFRDITERARFEDALRRSEERFRSVVENSSDLVTLMDGTGRISYQSPAISRMFGYGQDELIGRNALDLVHPEDLPEVATRLAEVASHPGEPRSAEFRFLHRDGHWVHVEAIGATLSPTDPQEGVVVNSRDISERKEAELALRETTRFLENLIASSPGVIFRGSGERLRTTYISPNAEAVFGFPAEGFLSDPQLWVERTHPDDRQTVTGKLLRAMERGDLDLTYEYRFLHADGGYRHLLASVRFERDETGSIEALGYTFDISPLKEAESGLRQAKEEAESANRAKSEFLSRMSHELRTPMNSILGFAQLLAKAELPAAQQRSVERIRDAGKHLLNLINEVLDLARIESGRQTLSTEPLEIGPLLRDALGFLRPLAAQRDCRIVEELPPETDRFVCGDRQRLSQVFINLLSNAVKYNRPGGEVGVVAEVVAGPVGEGTLRVGIRDSGPGIPAERMAELFLPFSRLGAEQSEVEGTGLGLALSKTLVETMGGKLFAESRPGEGSTFWVELPLAREPRQNAEAQRAALAEEPRYTLAPHPVTVLYVEDNRANLSLVEELFASYPEITLRAALRARDGIDAAVSERPDLVLLDLHLPDLPGEEVLVRLRSDPRTASIPVIVISADATPRQIQRLRALGARDYLTKPLDLGEFLTVISATLGGEGAPEPGPSSPAA